MINCFENGICAWSCTESNSAVEGLITWWIKESSHPSQGPLSSWSHLFPTPFFFWLSLVGPPALGRVSLFQNLLHFRMMEASVLSGSFRGAEVILLPHVSASVRLRLGAAEQFF